MEWGHEVCEREEGASCPHLQQQPEHYDLLVPVVDEMMVRREGGEEVMLS